MRDLHDNIGFAYLVEPATLAADNTPAAVDLRGFDAACIAVEVGVGGITFSGTNKVEFVLTHSDDNVTYAAVAQADILGVTVATERHRLRADRRPCRVDVTEDRATSAASGISSCWRTSPARTAPARRWRPSPSSATPRSAR
jgi:hypothetical protein